MIARLDAVDALLMKVVSVGVTVAAGAGAIASHGDGTTLMGIGMWTFLLALAGAGLILSFLPPRVDAAGNPATWRRILGTVGFCTIAAAGLGTLGIRWAAKWALAEWGIDIAGADPFLAFALGALGQWLIPLAIAEGPKGVVASLRDFLPWRKS